MKKRISLIILTVTFFGILLTGCEYNRSAAPPSALENLLSGSSLYPPLGDGISSIDTLFYTIGVGPNGYILRSTGSTNLVFQSVPSGTSQNLNSIRLSNNSYQNNIAVVGNNGSVLISTNTGISWTIKAPVTSANLYGVDHSYFLFCVGDNGTILYANEIVTGNLVLRTSGTTRNLKDVAMSPSTPQRVIVVGEKGTILRSSDTGFNWDNVSINDTTFNFYSISKRGMFFNSGDVYVAVGSQGKIYKSTDLGVSWQLKPSGTSNTLRSVYFVSLDSGVVVGDNGTIRFTTNGGETWFTNSYFNSPSTRNYKSVSCMNKSTATSLALADSIHIVSNDPITTGIQNISSELPEKFCLSQNYPNPFNPNTKIRFQISKTADVKLEVYDVRGKQIETLVNQELRTGTYEVDFNGNKYSSGIYFYKIFTSDFIETRKMMLVK